MSKHSVIGRGIEIATPLYAFMYALKSSESRRQYPKRLKMLFDYLNLPGPIEEQARSFTLVLPKQTAIELGVGKGDFLKCYVDGSRLIVERVNSL